ncbi:pyridoxamine 5'-phosphate oxidase family protein [Streptomyces albidoflavus]|uniref:pyridoxamine 5'-phosphate oxidase family protein n=1 Tax=Streptomyces albidoflavus TaxID=1886 RepID=UPI0033A2966B
MEPATEDFYGSGARRMQEVIGTRQLAEHIAERYVNGLLDEDATDIVRNADCFYLATADGKGFPECSYKGGLPGFVKVPEPDTLIFPSYDGNGMFRSLGNIIENPRVGLLFIDYRKPIKLRVNGNAAVTTESRYLDLFHDADAAIRVDVRQVFENCPRYLHGIRNEGYSPYVPRPGAVAPDPEWKLKAEYEGIVRLNGRAANVARHLAIDALTKALHD